MRRMRATGLLFYFLYLSYSAGDFLPRKKLEHWSNGEVEQWGGMESREVDRNLRIAIVPLSNSRLLQGARRPYAVY